jgi:beta-lactamase class A
MQRRDVLKGMAWGGAAIAAVRMAPAVARPALDGVGAKLAMLERRHGGRLGVAILIPAAVGAKATATTNAS